MSYQKIVLIIEKLIDKTSAGKIGWDETELENVYQAVFPEYSVRIWPRGDDFMLGIFNAQGALLEEVSDVDLADDLSESYRILKDLHHSAKRAAMGVEQALDGLLLSLEEKKEDEF